MNLVNNIKRKLLLIILASIIAIGFCSTNAVNCQPATTITQKVQTITQTEKALDIVKNPKSYLNKTVLLNAKFDKFSTLGLDYKPAFRSSEKYISFLIKRDDTTYDIPLSEMKLFLKREIAEKHIDLKTDDEIAITGTVFSDALGDAWIDVNDIKIIKKAPVKK